MGLKEDFREGVVPKAMAALEAPSVLEAIDGRRSEIKTATFTHNGDEYEILEQNKLKDSRFARLANNGHDVYWLIRKSDADWFLIVDGKWVNKQMVVDTGTLTKGAEF
jgi:hypothetical protein